MIAGCDIVVNVITLQRIGGRTSVTIVVITYQGHRVPGHPIYTAANRYEIPFCTVMVQAPLSNLILAASV